ncbi:MAG: 2-dehydropantoate 2-reductase [Pseudomonadota bacterium]|jgi:2-dehydropantoate 2-reductase
MKIAVFGAGAVGCYYGGMLARAGHGVTLIARPQHVAAIHAAGLRLQTQAFDEQVALSASSDPAALAEAEVLLCCVKSGDTPAAAAAMAPHLRPDCRVLSLQNGVDNAEQLQSRLTQPVAAAVVYVATEMAGPGHVRHHGRGELVVGPEALTPEQAAAFVAAGIPLQFSDNVLGALWAKLILNCAYNALSAIARCPYGELWQADGVQDVMRTVVAECEQVAAADGVRLPAPSWEAVERIARTMSAQLSSTAQDLIRGKPSEIEHLNGHVLRRGLALGIPTPANALLRTLVKLLEQRAAA